MGKAPPVPLHVTVARRERIGYDSGSERTSLTINKTGSYGLHRIRLALLTVSLMLVPYGRSPVALAQEHEGHPQMSTVQASSLLDLFVERQQHGHSDGDLRNAVKTFVLGCCSPKDAAIELLRANGFTVKSVSDPDGVKDLNEHWKFGSDGYDEFVFGTRHTSFRRFWDVFAMYEVVLFISDGKVMETWARVSRTLP